MPSALGRIQPVAAAAGFSVWRAVMLGLRPGSAKSRHLTARMVVRFCITEPGACAMELVGTMSHSNAFVFAKIRATVGSK
jgi:hypothetical protein